MRKIVWNIKDTFSRGYMVAHPHLISTGYASPTWKRAQVQGLMEFRLTNKGDKDQGPDIYQLLKVFVP